MLSTTWGIKVVTGFSKHSVVNSHREFGTNIVGLNHKSSLSWKNWGRSSGYRRDHFRSTYWRILSIALNTLPYCLTLSALHRFEWTFKTCLLATDCSVLPEVVLKDKALVFWSWLPFSSSRYPRLNHRPWLNTQARLKAFLMNTGSSL